MVAVDPTNNGLRRLSPRILTPRSCAVVRQTLLGECHRGADASGKFDLTSAESLKAGGESGAVIVPGKAEWSIATYGGVSVMAKCRRRSKGKSSRYPPRTWNSCEHGLPRRDMACRPEARPIRIHHGKASRSRLVVPPTDPTSRHSFNPHSEIGNPQSHRFVHRAKVGGAWLVAGTRNGSAHTAKTSLL